LKLGGWLGGGLKIDCNGDIFEPGGTNNFLHWFLERAVSKLVAKNKRATLLLNTIKLLY